MVAPVARPHSLIAYNADLRVIHTMDYLTALRDGQVVGLHDFAEHEARGGKMRFFHEVSAAIGSGAWPEWLGAAGHDFYVELDQDKRIVALRHSRSGFRRIRYDIERRVAKRINEAKGEPADLRDILGGPKAPLQLDENGRTIGRFRG